MKFTNVSFPVFFLSTIVLLFAACEKDDVDDSGTTEVFPTDCLLQEYTEVDDGTEYRYLYTYNDNGAIVSSTRYENGELTSSSDFERNSTNRLERINFFDESGNLSSYNTYEYGNDGSSVPSRYNSFVIDGSGSERLSLYIEYTAEGNKISEVRPYFINSSGEERLLSYTVYEYEEEANLLLVTAKVYDADDDSLVRSRVSTYDKDTSDPFLDSDNAFSHYFSDYALIKRESFDGSGQPDEDNTYDIVYEVDQANRNINIEEIDLEGNTTTYNLTFNCD